jgi:hypothetical protein
MVCKGHFTNKKNAKPVLIFLFLLRLNEWWRHEALFIGFAPYSVLKLNVFALTVAGIFC